MKEGGGELSGGEWVVRFSGEVLVEVGRVSLGLGFGGRGLGVLSFPCPILFPRIPRRSIFCGKVYSVKWRTMVGWYLFRGVLGLF